MYKFMGKVLSVLFSVLILSFSYGQVNLNDLERIEGLWVKKGDTKPFTGAFIEYYDNGNIKGEGEFKDGEVHGLRLMYYENGSKSLERSYKNGISEGASIEYYPSGEIKQEVYFKNGREEGTAKVFYENGNVQAILNFSKGVQNGDYYEFTPDGNLKAQYYFVNGNASYSPEFMDLTSQAIKYSNQFKYKQAIKKYDQAIEINPTVAQAYFNRGTCKSNSLDFEGAILDFDKAIELDSYFAEAYANRGNAKINILTTKGNISPTKEQTESACEDFYKAAELGDKSVGVEDLIYLYCKRNKK